jgi:hypothetical protein
MSAPAGSSSIGMTIFSKRAVVCSTLLLGFLALARTGNAEPAHTGTFELGGGLGAVPEDDSVEWIRFVGVGAGGWTRSGNVMTLRLAGVETQARHAGAESVTTYWLYLGPSVQVWLGEHAWLGGGLGLSMYGDADSEHDYGFAADLRAGYTFSGPQSASSFNVSLEVTPGMAGRFMFAAAGILVGYQYR